MNPSLLLFPWISLGVLSSCSGDSSKDDTSVSDTASSPADSGDSSSPNSVLEEDFQAGLSRFSGCGDVFMYASNPDDTLVLTFQASGGATAAHEAGESIDIPYDLLSDEATVSVVYGENITHELCNDAFWLEVIEKKRFEVTAGTATLRISPDPDTTEGSPELPADAILYLSNVVLEAPDGERAEFEQFTFQASVGWLPG